MPPEKALKMHLLPGIIFFWKIILNGSFGFQFRSPGKFHLKPIKALGKLEHTDLSQRISFFLGRLGNLYPSFCMDLKWNSQCYKKFRITHLIGHETIIKGDTEILADND